MTRFLFGDLLWRAIERRAKTARRTKAAIAYVTRTHPLTFRSGDLLVVDATDGAIACGRTSAAVLSKLHRIGVQLYSHDGLHAKCIILDSVLFTSSANLSSSSIDALFEAGIETDSPNSVSEAVGMIERLVKTSTEIDSAFIKRIKRIKVDPHFGGEKSIARTVSRRHRPALTWLIGVHDVEEPTDPVEINRINRGTETAEQRISHEKSGTGWIRLPHTAKLRSKARQGDNLILIDRGKESSNPERVYRHSPILVVQKEPTCTRVYYEDLPYAKRRALTWGQFKKVARLARIPGKLSKDITWQLSAKVSDDLNDYWGKTLT